MKIKSTLNFLLLCLVVNFLTALLLFLEFNESQAQMHDLVVKEAKLLEYSDSVSEYSHHLFRPRTWDSSAWSVKISAMENAIMAFQQDLDSTHHRINVSNELTNLRALGERIANLTRDNKKLEPFIAEFLYQQTILQTKLISEAVANSSETVLSAIAENNRAIFLSILISVFGLVLIFGMGFYIIQKRLVLTVTKLNDGLTKLEEGNSDFSLDVQAHDELSQLVRKFNVTVKQIEEAKATKKVLDEQINSQNQILSITAEQANLGYAMIRKGSSRLEFDPQFSELMKLNIEDVFSLDEWENYFKEEDWEAIAKTVQASPTDKPPVNKTFEIHLHGEQRYYHIRTYALDEKLLLSVQDVSRFKLLEIKALLLADKAEAASRAKSSFLSNMSHEIRTPMNGIIGLNSLLLSSSLNDDQREWALGLKSSAETLLTVINDILDVSKIESGKLNIETISFSLDDLLRQIESPSLMSAKEKTLAFKVTKQGVDLSRFMGDPIRIKQILLNLVGNAIKFTAEGSVSLNVNIEQGSDDKQDEEQAYKLKFIIADTGIGISPEQKVHLFDRFSQADSSTTRKFGGTGLGLSICKQLVQLMGGEIGVDSMEGEGSQFWFTLVLKADELPAEAKTSNVLDSTPTSVFSKQVKVLLVEDHKINQVVAENIFDALGMETHTAENGLVALEMLEKETYDLIFMDCHMPEMDGFEATRRIKTDERLKHLPVLALTAGAMEEEHQQCYEAGMELVITKPFEPEDIIKAVQKILDS